MLLEFFVLLVLPVLIDVLLIEVILSRWDKGCNNFFVPQVLPGKIFEPWVLLHLEWAILTKSVDWLSLYHLHNLLFE